MSIFVSNYRCTLNSDSQLSITSHINDWYFISDNVCTKIDELLDLINGGDGI